MSLKKFLIDQRWSVAGDICTIRYIGLIPAWPEEVAIGVEWDNESRGKNDGSLDGVCYFSTFRGLKSGSFMKMSKFEKNQEPKPVYFLDALVSKYTDVSVRNADISQIKIGTKQIESYGFDELMEFNRDIRNLRVVSLDRQGVYDADIGLECGDKYDLGRYAHLIAISNLDHCKETFKVLEKLVNLDLSFNLYTSSYYVLKTLLQVPNLELLNLSNNNLVQDDAFLSRLISNSEICLVVSSFKLQFFRLKTLILAKNRLRKSTLILFLLFFTRLDELDLSNNFIEDSWFLEDYVSEIPNEPTNIQELNQLFGESLKVEKKLDKCLIHINTLKFLIYTKSALSLKILNLSFNKLTTIPWVLLDVFENRLLKDLNLSYNDISIFDGMGKPRMPYPVGQYPNVLKYNDLTLNWQWKHMRKLNLSHNNISMYQELDILNCKFPNLEEIHLKDVKIYQLEALKISNSQNHLPIDPQERVINEVYFKSVFRFNETLAIFNKSRIVLEERANSELYFISKFKESSLDDDMAFSQFGTARLNQLCEKYGVMNIKKSVPNKSQPIIDYNSLQANLITLKLRFHTLENPLDPLVVNECFVKNITILKFKGILKHLFNLYSVLEIQIFFTLQFDHPTGPIYNTEEITNDQHELSHYGLKDGDPLDVYISDVK